MKREGGFNFGVNHSYVAGCIEQKADSRLGFILMTIGFLLQAVAYFIKVSQVSLGIILILALSTVTIIVLIIILDRIYKKRSVKQYIKSVVLNDLSINKDKIYNPSDSTNYLKILDITYNENDDATKLQNILLNTLNINR